MAEALYGVRVTRPSHCLSALLGLAHCASPMERRLAFDIPILFPQFLAGVILFFQLYDILEVAPPIRFCIHFFRPFWHRQSAITFVDVLA